MDFYLTFKTMILYEISNEHMIAMNESESEWTNERGRKEGGCIDNLVRDRYIKVKSVKYYY